MDKRAFPVLYDYDEDGLLDIITGTRSGTLNFVKNTGTSNEIHLALGQSFLGMVKETNLGNPIGYSAPYISALDNSNKPYLLVHSRSGSISIFDDLQADKFVKVEEKYNPLKTGGGGGIAVSDFNEDGLYEIIVGTESGGVQLFSQEQKPNNLIQFNTNHCSKDTIIAIESHLQYQTQIYPTIVENQLFIYTTLPLNASYKIFNIEGQLILAGNLHHNPIELNALHKGIYFLNTSNNTTLRFFKK